MHTSRMMRPHQPYGQHKGRIHHKQFPPTLRSSLDSKLLNDVVATNSDWIKVAHSDISLLSYIIFCELSRVHCYIMLTMFDGGMLYSMNC